MRLRRRRQRPRLPRPRQRHRCCRRPTDTHHFTLADDKDDVVGRSRSRWHRKAGHAAGHRPALQRRLRGNRARKSGRRPVDSGRRTDAIVVPTRFVLPNAPREGIVIDVAAMRLFYFPPHKKGEPQDGLHPSDRHRQGRLVDARRRHTGHRARQGSGAGDPRRHCAWITATTMARICRRSCRRGPITRWASMSFASAGRAI